MNNSSSQADLSASQRIRDQIAGLADWRGQTLARLRLLILEAGSDLTEEWKWETAVWTQRGNVIAAGVFKDHVKLNFFKGAFLEDPNGLFNAGLEAKATRAIDFFEGDVLPETALKALIQAAVAYNLSSSKKK